MENAPVSPAEVPLHIQHWVAEQIKRAKIEVKMEILYCLDSSDHTSEEDFLP